MNLLLIIGMAFLLLLPLFLRGGALHNHIVNEAGDLLRRAGFEVSVEHAIRLGDGRHDFVDLLVRGGTWEFCIEVETSARYILTNAAKVETIGLPLWVVVPNKKVRQSVVNKLDKASYRPGGLKIYILLLGQLNQTVTNYFPLFSPANENKENRKTNGNEGET